MARNALRHLVLRVSAKVLAPPPVLRENWYEMPAERMPCPGRGKLRRELHALSPECRPVDQGGMKPVLRVVAACPRADDRVRRRPGVVDVTGGISRFQGVCPPQLPPGRWPAPLEPSSSVGWYPAPPAVGRKCAPS